MGQKVCQEGEGGGSTLSFKENQEGQELLQVKNGRQWFEGDGQGQVT